MKYKKDWLILVSVVLLLLMAVMGGHFADVANKPGWWNFWQGFQWFAIVVIIIGWVYAWVTQNDTRGK